MKNTTRPVKLLNYNMDMMKLNNISNDAAASAALASMNSEERLLTFVSVLVNDECLDDQAGNGSNDGMAA